MIWLTKNKQGIFDMGKTGEDYKNEVVTYAKILDEKGLVNTVEGNLSVLDRETGKLYVTPSGTRKRFLDADKIAVMQNGEQVEGSLPRSSEYLMHLEALNARPTCNAVAHVHSPYLTAYAYCGKDISIKCSSSFAILFGEKIPCITYGEAATSHIADGLAEALKDNDLVLLANHGVISVGRTLEDSVKLIEAAEEVMKIYSYAKQIGQTSDLSDEQLESIFEHHPGSKRNRLR